MLQIFVSFLLFVFLPVSLIENVNSIQEQSYKYGNVYQNREELVIGNVTSYDHFELGRGVTKWKSVTIEGKNYAVGLMQAGICIFSAEMDSDGTLVLRNATNIIHQFVDVELVKYWNSTAKKDEVIAVFISNAFSLEWFRISDSLELEKIWTWNLHKTITHIKIFKFLDRHHLIVLKKQARFTVDLYEFTLDDHGSHFWMLQTIPLEHVAQTSAFNVYDSNYFLSIPQDQHIFIFKYQNNRFITFANISNSNADRLDSFNIGFESYLIVNGKKSGIYKFNSNGVTREEIENTSMDGINYWLPLQLRTYKDEVILLGQKILDHDDHKSKKIELITSSGNDFFIHEEIPCKYYGDVLSGIDCLVEEENHNNSINGSAVLMFDRMLGIIVPRRDSPSGLFLLSVNIKQIPNPIQKQMANLRSIKQRLEKMMEDQKKSIELIRKSEKISDTETDNVHTKKTTPEYAKMNGSFYDTTKSSPSNQASASRSSEESTLEHFQGKVNDLQHYIDKVREELKTAIRTDSGPIVINDLVVKNIISIKGKTRTKDLQVDKINDIEVEQLITDFVRIADNKPVTAKKTFANLDIERIDVNTVNGNDVSNMYFKSEVVNFNGVLMINKPVEVRGNVVTTSGMINDHMNLSDVLTVGKPFEDDIEFDNVKTETIEVKFVNKLPVHSNYFEDWNDNLDNVSNEEFDKLYMPGNVTVENINGEKLQDILDRICIKNVNTTIQGNITVDGDVRVIDDIKFEYLNGLKFPEEYVFNEHDPNINFITFTGKKFFENEVTVHELNSEENISGIDTETVITLSKNQTIPGQFTFTDLEVVGGLDVNGTITGVQNILPNPTIKETKRITANVNFKMLEIEGMLIIGNTVNDTHLEQLLEDVVFKNEKAVAITAIKNFKNGLTVSGNTNIHSNSINGIRLDTFVDKTSEQVLSIDVLNGNVTFENLSITGRFGGINITELNEETVKLSGTQHISSTLNFMEDLSVRDFQIRESLNEIPADSYVFKTGDRFLPFLNTLDEVHAETLTVDGNLNGTITNFDIREFVDKRLSLTKAQEITATYTVKNMSIDNLKAWKINDYDFDDLTDSKRYHGLLFNRILENKIKINDLKIVGDLRVKSINGILMEDVMKVCLYEGDNRLKPNISFRDNVEFSKVTIENLNHVPFDSFIANLVYKNETDVVFEGLKIFTHGFVVNKYIDAESINEIPIEDILRKSSNQQLSGKLVIKGNVSISSDTTVGENLNGVPIKQLAEVFDPSGSDTFTINGDAVFDKLAYIDEMHVNGFVNDRNLTEFLKEIVHLGDDIVVPGLTTFTNPVQINGNIGVMERINNIDLSKFVNDVVSITYDAYIQGLVSFEGPVHVKDMFIVESDLLCDSIVGVNIADWRKNAVFVNEELIPGKLHFESVTISHFINTDFINSINMSAIIPLRTNQYIPEGLYFQEMSANGEIKVDNLVLGIKLEQEFKNTLLNEGPQEIYSEIEFIDSVVVHGNFETNGPANAINLNKIVTINTDQNLTASYIFKRNVVARSDVQLHGLINNINVSEWQNRGLKRQSDYIQTVKSPLNIAKNLTFENDVKSTGLIGEMNIMELAAEIAKRSDLRESIERKLVDDYGKMCDDVNSLLGKAKTQIYKFKYFDYFQFIHFNNDINVVHYFEHENVHYMLTNERSACKSHLYSWSVSGFSLVNEDIETGMVLQFITVKDKNNSLYLVGRSESYDHTLCSLKGTNVWKFIDAEEISHENQLENFQLLKESKIPGTFYGLSSEFVYEYNIKSYADSSLKIFRKWKIEGSLDNLAFIPHGLGTGLALRGNHKILRLTKQESSPKGTYANDHNLDEIAIENVIEERNFFIPGRQDEFVIVNVARPRTRTVTATTTHEEVSIEEKSDFVKIYDDILNGKLFHKIPTYKPSSLLSLEFGNSGETLLAFLEDEKFLQLYEYKGLEGFKLRSSMKEEGQQLVAMRLPFPSSDKMRNFLAVINHSKLTLMEAVMDGNFIDEEKLQCTLP